MDDLLDLDFDASKKPSTPLQPALTQPSVVTSRSSSAIPSSTTRTPQASADPFATLFEKRVKKQPLAALEQQMNAASASPKPASQPQDLLLDLSALEQLSVHTSNDSASKAQSSQIIEPQDNAAASIQVPVPFKQTDLSHVMMANSIGQQMLHSASPLDDSISHSVPPPAEQTPSSTPAATHAPPASAPVSPSIVRHLQHMGFEKAQAERACKHADSVEEAIDYILSERAANTHTPPQKQTSTQSFTFPKNDFQSSASELGRNLLAKATDLWNIGRQKFREAVENSHRQSSSQPRWMEQAERYRPSTPTRPVSPRRTKTPSAKVVEAATPSLFDSFTQQTSSSPSLLSSVKTPKTPVETVPEKVARTEAVPETVTQMQQEGNELFRQGNFDQAIVLFTNALQLLPPQHAQRVLLLGNRALGYLKIGDARRCLQDSQEATSIIGAGEGEGQLLQNKDASDLFVKNSIRKAQAYEMLEQYTEALATWKHLFSRGKTSKVVLEGKTRCERALNPRANATAPTRSSVSTASTPARTRPPSATTVPVTESEAFKHTQEHFAAAERQDQERDKIRDEVLSTVDQWKAGKEDNIRALLASLHTILWPECSWKTVQLSELVLPKKVKIAYMKAISKVHPDKLAKDTSPRNQFLAESVFSILNRAWDTFRQTNQI
ncbi:UBA/TPR/DNAJ domain-containing protein Ucp7 [Schizosaccharomyces japonicus yFS275]|uniref:UBA/TPR/DNAJ domain-containing protein Ucp7 n=1 Tax=Schizosaccharomyces japonicus (strain yFS275 / FY16936) TaxID=402676 RepID=B6K3T3_SCHJY|nr:UBA/TPR/DNAJ domain-containing protein Ucp7 [Schizosaccharomyces japonicus yFS275]EEB08140.1 UBA/TPR/DNAJ domain-containing protein Ucp7 [Schizosaccharomyces japonicus yFS275]